MARDERLGDKMPDRRAVKWGDMKAGTSHLSDEWHDMEACDPVFSEKWDGQKPSSPRMSEKWVDMDAANSQFSDEWHEMKQEGRIDPYQMAPSEGDRMQASKSSPKIKPDNKVGRATQHTEFGSTREI